MAETDTPVEPDLSEATESMLSLPAEGEDTEIEEDNIDLKPYTLAETIRTQRDLAFAPDIPKELQGKFLSVPEIVEAHSQRLGISKQRLKRAAANQGLDLSVLITGIGSQGRDVNDVFKELKDLGTVAFDPPETRTDKMKEFRRARMTDQRQVDINQIANAKIDAGKVKFNFSPEELAVTRPQKTVDFTKIKNPSKRQAAVAEIVYDMGSDTGMSRDQMAAILANGIAESRLDPFAESPGSEDSHGIWQFNRGGSGEGVGFTVEQLQDPKFQMEKIIAATKDRDELKGFRDTNADANELTKQFMIHFEKPQNQSETKIKQRQSYVAQAQRLLDEAEKNSPKAQHMAKVTKEKSKQLKRIVNEGSRVKFRVGTDREAPGGDVANEVVKPGSKVYKEVEDEVEILINPDKAREKGGDPKRARLMQNLLAKYRSGDTSDQLHNLFEEGAFYDLYSSAVNYDVDLAASKLGIDPNEFMLKAKDARSKEGQIWREILRSNRDQAAKFQTLNKLGVPAFVSYEFMDPDNWMGERRTDSDDPYLSRWWDATSGNRVELVGLDKDKIPVFRAQHHLASFADKLDLVLSMGAGALERSLRGPEDESLGEAIKEGSIEGIKNARNLTKFMLSTEAARSNGISALALGMVGFGGDILTPDPTIGLAMVASSTRKAAKKIAPLLNKRHIPKALDDMDTVATEMIESQKLIVRAKEEFAAGNIEAGQNLLDQAKEAALKAERAERNIKSKLPKLMEEVDRTDGGLAREIARDTPIIKGGKESDQAAKEIGFSDFGVRRDFVHPSYNRIEARGGGDSQIVRRSEFFDVSTKIDNLKDLATRIEAGDVGKAYTPEVLSEALTPLQNTFATILAGRGFSKAKSAKTQSPEVTDSLISFFDFLGSTRTAEMMVEEPEKFRATAMDMFNRIPTLPRKTEIFGDLEGDITKALDKAAKIAARSDKATEAADLSKTLVDVTDGVAGIAESRGASHALVRGAIAGEQGVKIKPSIPDVASRYDEIGNDKISFTALDFRNELETAFPALRGDSAMHIARYLDARLKAIHRETNEPVEIIFETREFKDIIPNLKRKQLAETGEEAADVQFSKVLDSEGRDYGFENITTKEIRDLIDDSTDLGAGLGFKVEDGVLSIREVALPENLQGKGIATKLYKAALRRAKEAGLSFTSDQNPTPEVAKIYERLMEEGIPIEVKTVRESGRFVTRYTISSDKLSKVSDDLLEFVDEAKQLENYKNLWLPDFVEDGQKTVRAMEEATNVEDFMLEINRISRHELNQDQMSAVTKWLSSKGIKVGFRGSRFVADDPAAIQQAEETFARAFAEYVDGQPPPTEKIESAFERVKGALVDRFASAKNASVDGAKFNPSAEIEKVFGDMLANQPANSKNAPKIFSIIKRALIDDLPTNTTQEFLVSIAKETDRMGNPISVKELKQRMVQLVEQYKKADPLDRKDIRIELPAPVSLGGLLSPTGPKQSFTLEEFSRGALNYAQRKRLIDNPGTRKIALESDVSPIRELQPTQIIDQYLSQSNVVKRFIGRTYLGFDALEDMRDLPPKVREAIMAGTRMTQQSIGDAVSLVSDGDYSMLLRYLTGDPTVKLRTGRQVFSAGHDSVSDGFESFRSYIESFALEDAMGYNRLVEYFETGKIGKKSATQFPDEVAKAAKTLILNSKGNRLLKDIFGSLKPGHVIESDSNTIRPEHLEIIENLFYHTGKSRRKNAQDVLTLFRGSSRQQFDSLYKMLDEMYPMKTAKDHPVANRVAVLFSAHGAAMKARKEWVDLGIAVDAKTAADFKKWIIGEGLDTDAEAAKVKQAFQVFGYNPRFMEALELDGFGDVWVPAAARRKLALALEQATDPTIKLDFGMLETIGQGLREANMSAAAAAFTFRYLKTKMVRGHFLLKSRYFWMNTMDHFNQMSQIVGFRPAFISSVRLVPQSLVTNPWVQTALVGIQKAGKDDVGEVMRGALSAAGDEGARWASALMRASKWNGSLDAMMEGRDGFVLAGGVPYAYKDLKRIGVEEGLAASFQTTELGTKIRRVGQMFLNNYEKKTGLRQLLGYAGADIPRWFAKMAEDLAEGWSERERFGAMLTLVEMGVEPRKAARLAIDALYDYAGSMSKFDRNMLVQIFFPFWAFQKNANRQLVDVLFSPRGAYRLGVLRRSYERQGEFFSEMMYEGMVDPLGINVDMMDDNELEAYDALKTSLEDYYGVPIAQLPENLRRSIRMAVTGRSSVYENGKLYKMDDEARRVQELSYADPKTGKVIPRFYKGRYPRSFVEKPSPATMPKWTGSRDAGLIPYAVNEQNKIWNDLMNATDGTSRTYTAVMFPEQSYKAAGNFFMYLTATYFHLGREIATKVGPEYFMDPIDEGSETYSWSYPMMELLRPESALFVSDAAGATGLDKNPMPYQLAPTAANFLRRLDWEILPVDAKEDPFKMRLSHSEFKRRMAAGDIEAIPEDPYLNGETLLPQNNYYLPGGVAAFTMQQLVPGFDQVNTILKQMEMSQPEELSGLRGELQRVLRVYGVLDTRDFSPEKVARSGGYQKLDETRDQQLLEIKKKQNLKYLNLDDFARQEDARAKETLERLKKQDPGDMEIDLE